MNNMPELRRPKLKEMLENNKIVRVLEASNGLSGLIVEKTNVNGKEFDAMWLSSLCDSAYKGKSDNECVDFSSRIETINEILEVTTKPIIIDGDTGGKIEYFIKNILTLERLGVSAIVIEDKKGTKHNSLLGDKVKQELEDIDMFSYKIAKGKSVLNTSDFMIFARIESLIAGKDIFDALKRADAYINAGADGIMIHSYKKDGIEIISFLKEFRNKHKDIPVILVPTTFNHFNENDLKRIGANIIIYANHLLRGAYKAMKKVATTILDDECSKNTSENDCVSMEEILNLTGD